MHRGVVAALLFIHHCPFPHTGGISTHDQQNIWLATTQNDELQGRQDIIASLSVQEAHWGEYFQVSFVPEGAFHKMRDLHQDRDTPYGH